MVSDAHFTHTDGRTYRLMVITLSVWYTALRATTRLKNKTHFKQKMVTPHPPATTTSSSCVQTCWKSNSLLSTTHTAHKVLEGNSFHWWLYRVQHWPTFLSGQEITFCANHCDPCDPQTLYDVTGQKAPWSARWFEKPECNSDRNASDWNACNGNACNQNAFEQNAQKINCNQ